MKKLVGTLLLVAIMCVITACGANNSVTNSSDQISPGREYECNYHTLSLKTWITTTIHGEDVKITGNLFRIITDPLKMESEEDGRIIGTADDDYNLIKQDSHAIKIGDTAEILVSGEFDPVGETYTLYDLNGNDAGYVSFNFWNTSGTITDVDGNLVAEYHSFYGFNDYTVTIYDNDLCSDEAILLIMASYVSDFIADNSNN